MPRSLRSWFSLLLITALVPIPAAISQEKILATVNGKPLTEADMRLAAIEFAADLSVVAAADRDRMLLELLIEQQLVADAAQKANLDQKVDFADRVRFLTRRALRDQFMEWQIIRTVTEADARRVYDKQAQARKPEDELRVRHILVTSESEATELSARVSRRNFAALAQQLSKDRANSWNGGDLGYITKGQMDEDFEATAFSLKPGAISEPVRTRFGWHIILVEDRRAREVPSFESIKDDIVRLLIQRKVQEAVSTLRTDAKIEITDPDLSRAVVQAKAPPTTPDQAVGSVASAAPEGPSAVYAFTKGVEYSVASEHLNLRRGPNPEADVLAKLESGTTGVFWLGDAKDHEDERWVKVKVGEQIGWVNDRFIRPVVAPNLDIDQKPDQEFDGESYRAPTVATYEVCRHACLLDERCKAMEFNRKEKVCYLFDTVPKIGRSSRADAGIKRAASR